MVVEFLDEALETAAESLTVSPTRARITYTDGHNRTVLLTTTGTTITGTLERVQTETVLASDTAKVQEHTGSTTGQRFLRSVRERTANLASRLDSLVSTPTGEMAGGRQVVALAPQAAAVLFHQLSHYLEMDMCYLGSSPVDVGDRIGPDGLTVEDVIKPGCHTARPFDAEGRPTQPTTLVDGGEVVNKLHDTASAVAEKEHPSGNVVPSFGNERGHWRGRDRWPTAADDSLEYAVTPGGLEKSENHTDGRVETEYEFDHTVGIHTMEQEVNVLEQPPDTTPDDIRSLSFETDTLETPVEFTGSGEMTVRIRSTTPDPVIAVRVMDVLPDGTARPVTTGHIQASHRNGHEEPEPLTTGEPTELTIPLKPKSHVFEPGHRIRFAISGSMFPRAMPAPEHGSVTLLSTPDARTSLSFPGAVHDTEPTFDEFTGMNPPEEEPFPTTSPYVVEAESDVRTVRQRRDTSGESGVYETTEQYVLELPHGPVLTMDSTVRAGVEARDPRTASIIHETDLTLDYGYETVEVENVGRVAQHTADISTTVRVDGQVVFDEMWHR